MIEYLLDTDIASYLMKPSFPQVQQRYAQIPPESCAVSAITCAEILFGLESVSASHASRPRAIAFLQAIQILDWPMEAAAYYADIRNRLRRQNIGDRDIMIAAHSISIGAILVTNNTSHFSRIGPPLRMENWVS